MSGNYHEGWEPTEEGSGSWVADVLIMVGAVVGILAGMLIRWLIYG